MQTIASFRKMTPGILASAALAMQSDHAPVTKAQVASALKKCAGRLGIKGYTYQILDTLLAISPAKDWTHVNRPVVAISNARLAYDLGVSEKTVSRAIRALVEAGIVAYRDSPTGRRYVNREGGGSFGLDFSPARHRLAELEELASAHVETWRLMRETTRQCQGVARQIVDALEQLRRDGHQTKRFEDQFNRLVQHFHEQRSQPEYLSQLVDLLNDVLALYAPFERDQDCAYPDNEETIMSPTQDKFVTPYTTTTSPHSVEEKRNRADARSVNKSEIGKADQMAFEKKPVRAGAIAQAERPSDTDPATTLDLLRLGCRQLQAEYGIGLQTWHDLERNAETVRTPKQSGR